MGITGNKLLKKKKKKKKKLISIVYGLLEFQTHHRMENNLTFQKIYNMQL